MSVWRVLIEGLTSGFLESGGLERLRNNNGVRYEERGRIERLCREIGWITQASWATASASISNARWSASGDCWSRAATGVALLSVMSFAEVPAHNFPHEILSYLLARNAEMVLATWSIQTDEHGAARFFCRYDAIGMGLHSGLFKYACEKLLAEVSEFDLRMRKAGLL